MCFTPGCESLIIQQIQAAESEIQIQAYSFTSARIAKALLDAHKRGVDVQIILDKSNSSSKYSSYTFFKNTGIKVYIDPQHSKMHDKIMIIDRKIVITGSFNFTRSAEEKNAENVIIMKSKDVVEKYMDNWNEHKEHSKQ